MKYRTEIDVVALISGESGASELFTGSVQGVLLAVGAGLRKKEIDLLEWSSFGGTKM
jgi:hypothetical protein